MPRVHSFIWSNQDNIANGRMYHRAMGLDKQVGGEHGWFFGNVWVANGEGMMTGIDLLGFAAGTLTTCAFWPQLQKTWVSKSAGDVSLGMLAVFTAGVCLWFLYGLVLQSWPIILTNAVTLILTGAILVLKLRYR
jgi:MtN3 and saliva related transmembrane protein